MERAEVKVVPTRVPIFAEFRDEIVNHISGIGVFVTVDNKVAWQETVYPFFFSLKKDFHVSLTRPGYEKRLKRTIEKAHEIAGLIGAK